MTDTPVESADSGGEPVLAGSPVAGSPVAGSSVDGSTEHSRADSARVAVTPVPSLVPSLLIAAILLAADQITKIWAVGRLSRGRTIDLVGSLRFNLVFNEGMAFSRFRGIGQYIGVLAMMVVIFLAVSLRRADSKLGAMATGMIIGGAIGNIVDRLFRGDGWLKGGVVDFIDLQWWPIFNVADIGVTVGGVLLVLSSLLRSRVSTPTSVVAQ